MCWLRRLVAVAVAATLQGATAQTYSFGVGPVTAERLEAWVNLVSLRDTTPGDITVTLGDGFNSIRRCTCYCRAAVTFPSQSEA